MTIPKEYFVIVCMRGGVQYDCLADHKIHKTYEDAEDVIGQMKVEDEKNEWNYLYKIEPVWFG